MESRPLIICNTTPIINFAEIGRLDLLESLFGRIAIPPAVVVEREEKASIIPRAAAAEAGHPFIQEMASSDRRLVRGLSATLHPGEAECLALGLERPGALLVLDDLAARECAAANGLLFTGTLGCLAEAKARGMVPALAPLMTQLRHEARFWIADRLRERVLRDAGELS